MSESKKKMVNDAGPSRIVGPNGSKLCESIKELFALVTEMKTHLGEAADLDKTMEHLRNEQDKRAKKEKLLQESIEERDEVIKKLTTQLRREKDTKDLLKEEFSDWALAYDKKMSELTQFQQRSTDLGMQVHKLGEESKKLKAKSKQLEEELRSTGSRLEKAENKNKELSARLNALQAERDAANLARLSLNHKLRVLEGDGGPPLTREEVDAMGPKLEELASATHELAMKYFQSDVRPSSVESLKTRYHSLPISRSSSDSAKLIRCACAESVIAQALTDYVFASFHFQGDLQTQRAISRVLGLFDNDAHRRQVVRHQLLSEYPPEPEAVVEAAIQAVATVLDPLLPYGDANAKFHLELPRLFHGGLQIWSSVQKRSSSQPVVVELAVNLQWLEQEDRRAAYDPPSLRAGGSDSASEVPGGMVLLPLFPQMRYEGDLVFHGYALWSTHAAVTAAWAELDQKRLSSSFGNALPTRAPRARRPSEPRMVSSPQSPSQEKGKAVQSQPPAQDAQPAKTEATKNSPNARLGQERKLARTSSKREG